MKTINYNNKEYTQVQKRTAEKLYNDGKTVYIIPCNANPCSGWIDFLIMPNEANYIGSDKPTHEQIQELYPFQKVVNQFEHYNCNSELGRYSHFYIIK